MNHFELKMTTWAMAVVLGLVVCPTITLAQNNTRQSASTWHSKSTIPIMQTTAVRLRPPIEGPLVIPPALAKFANRLEPLPQGKPIVVTDVYVDLRTTTGSLAGIAVETVSPEIFRQSGDSGFFLPIKSSDVGSFVANQMGFGNGFLPGDMIDGYNLSVFNDSDGPSGDMVVTVSLWDGDPFGTESTSCSTGGVPGPIPGTTVTFGPLSDATGNGFGGLCEPGQGNCLGLWNLRASFDPVQVDCDQVYMHLAVDQGCRVGWRLAGAPFNLIHSGPQVGFSDFIEMAYDCGQGGQCATTTGFSSGTCCGTGEFCDHSESVGDCSHESFCTSGIADTTSAFSFGGTIGQDGYFASLVGGITATPKTFISIVPVSNGANGLHPSVTVNGQEMFMPTGNRGVIMDVFLNEFDPDDTGIGLLHAAVGFLDESPAYSSGSRGTLTPWRTSCLEDADCEATLGNIGTGNTRGGCVTEELHLDTCSPVWVDKFRSDYLFCDSTIPNCAQPDSFGRVLAACFPHEALCVTMTTSGVFPRSTHSPHYLMNLALFVPSDAQGTFTIIPNLVGRYDIDIVTEFNTRIPLIGVIPAKITVGEVGRCCHKVDGEDVCTDQVFADGCATLYQAGRFTAGGTCELEGICTDCNANGIPDLVELDNPRVDCNANGILDFCESIPTPNVPKNRFITLLTDQIGPDHALQVEFTNLAIPFDVLNGVTMWAGEPREINTNSGRVSPTPDYASFSASLLQCQPFFTDWSSYEYIEIYGENIVPGSVYTINLFANAATPQMVATLGAFPTSRWGDITGGFDAMMRSWDPPDGSVDIVSDAVAVLDSHVNRACAPSKTWAELWPAIPDHNVNVVDLTLAVDAFRGFPYPFKPGPTPCE